MTAPFPPSRLNTDSRRALALLAGDDLDPAAAAEARALAEECPHCRGHFESVREGLDVLRQCEPVEQAGGLWPSVRDGLTVAAPAVAPSAARPWMPAFAVTAAALLVGLFVYGPSAGETLPSWFEPVGEVRQAADGLDQPTRDRRPADGVRSAPFVAPPFQRGPSFREAPGRGTLDGPRVSYPR